jgi:hypothetical protein
MKTPPTLSLDDRTEKSSVQELPWITEDYFPESSDSATYAKIKSSMIRNQQLNRVSLLLVSLLPALQRQQHAAGMMLKILHSAITKFATVPYNAGTSATIKLLQARPASCFAAAANDSKKGDLTTTSSVGRQKRRHT